MLWGPSKNFDYWTARHADCVPPEERRAMALLASITDERRFSLYCLTGQMMAMGNVTKRIYLVRRHATVLELEDGRPYKTWCIGTPDRHYIPETDHVVTMKTLIEGEEMAFRQTGNPSRLGGSFPASEEKPWFQNPYLVPFVDHHREKDIRDGGNAEFSDFMDIHRERQKLIDQFVSQKKRKEEIARRGPPPTEDEEHERPNIQIQAAGGAGAFLGGYAPAINATAVPALYTVDTASTLNSNFTNTGFAGQRIQIGGLW